MFLGSPKSGSKKQNMFYVWQLFGYMFRDSDCKGIVYAADSCRFPSGLAFLEFISMMVQL